MAIGLRDAILQAAVQGKLTEREPGDEPAKSLLERIRAERAEMVKRGEAKAPRGGESVIERRDDGSVWEKRGKGDWVDITEEIPFDIPEEWEWVRFSQLCKKLTDGSHNPPPKCSKGYRVISAMNIQNGLIDLALCQRFADEDGFLKENPRTNISYGDLILGIIGGSIGNVAIYNHDEKVIAQRSIAIIDTFDMNDLMFYMLQTPLFKSYYAGATGTAQGGVYLGAIGNMLTPLPSVEEQKRIVMRIEEMLPKVERAEALDTKRMELTRTFPGAMRASILQAAVQGELTERDDDDEPACDLLARVREERRELVKKKLAKAPKGGESVIKRRDDGSVWEKRGKGDWADITEEVPFDIPDEWEWARLGDISNFGSCVNIEYADVEDGIWVLELECVEKDSGCVAKKVYKKGGSGSTKHAFKKGMVLYSKLRPYLNKVVVADEDGVCTSEILPLIFPGLNERYAQLALMTPEFLRYANEHSSGVKMPRLNTEAGKRVLIPIPSIQEQQRIVAKLEEMLPKVGRLADTVSKDAA